VSAAVLIIGGPFGSETHFGLVNPGIDIPEEATDVHEITTEEVKAEGRNAPEAIEEITSTLTIQVKHGIPIAAFNAPFDLTILDREARRYGIKPLIDRVGENKMLVLDPKIIDKQIDRYRKGKRTLEALCQEYGVPLENAHSALNDALAAATLADKLLAGGYIEVMTPTNKVKDKIALLHILHREQIRWAAEQAESLQQFYESHGEFRYIEKAWPIVPYSEAALR